MNKAANTEPICTHAKDLSLRRAFRIAVSPPVTANIPTAGDRRMKCRLWSPQAKVVLLRNGPMAIQTSIPNRAVSSDQALTTFTKWMIWGWLSSSEYSDRWRTALVEIPKCVDCEINDTVVLNSVTSPMPDGPSSRATNLLRTRLTITFSPCTPPKIPVYFNTCP